MDPDAVAKAFVQNYYQTFDTNRAPTWWVEGRSQQPRGDRGCYFFCLAGKISQGTYEF
jgi:hypothetical protein